MTQVQVVLQAGSPESPGWFLLGTDSHDKVWVGQPVGWSGSKPGTLQWKQVQETFEPKT
jgi:hypothetical protein